jgi:signal transduction histidine kinase/CheY-like chemotaxis protein/ligand-binding sensor domain-containing protein/AraC-like DNA-binding protein
MAIYQTYPRRSASSRWSLLLLLVMVGGGFTTARAQSMRTIATQDGLPQSFVSGIVQDDSSFIWIATRNGIVRFDGIQYKIFQHHIEDSNSLASNFIIWLRRDPKNRIWIEHESGVLDEMDPVMEKITHFLKGGVDNAVDVTFIRRGWMVDRDSLFWGITKGQGVSTFSKREKKAGRYNRANAGFASDTARGLVETADHGIWILSKGELSRFDKKTSRFSHWPIPFKEDYGDFLNSDAVAIDLHERKNGELMWGDRSSVYFFAPGAHRFRKIALPSVSYLGVRWIRTAPDGSDYFESYGNLFRYDDASGLTMVGKTIADNFGDAKSFFVDRSGLIWIGTNARGIKQIDLSIPYFKSFPYQKEYIVDLLKDQCGLDMPQLFGWTPTDNLSSDPSYQFRSVYGAHQRLYLSLKRTVGYIDSGTKRFVPLPPLPLGTRITGLALTPNGTPVVASTIGNIFSYDPHGKAWHPFLDTGFLRKNVDSTLRPQDMATDQQHIWLTTEKSGLFSIDLLTHSIRHFQKKQPADSLPTNELLGLCADPVRPGLLWVASYQGLIRLDKTTGAYKLFSLKEGLPDNTIYSILPDANGNLWLSTNKGICRFEPATGRIRVFGSRQGLPGDEFNRFHQLKLPDGLLTFGSTAGWTIFDPLMVKDDAFEPKLALNELRVNNKVIIETPKSKILTSPLNANRLLTLPYDQNTISIGFAGLEFSQPQQLQYRYRLVGYDADWVFDGNAHQAVYTKIPPGHYTLLLNASNTSGKWSGYTKTIDLHINSPWWSTPLAYLCYSIILAGLIWTFIRFRVSRTIMKREMMLKEMETNQLKELDDMKTRFFSNITHEFRTPLTLIIGPAEQLKTEHPQDGRINSLANGIIYNSKQLLTLVNRLMELAKLESGTGKLLLQSGNPTGMTGLVVQSFETDARARHIALSFADAMVPANCSFYADALERIVYNLVSNALKFTNPGGKVEVSLSADQENLILSVDDTGIGIPADDLPHIFDRFYQVEQDARRTQATPDTGTGIGLAMVKELIDQMGGRIEVQSRTAPPTGTSFTLLLPYTEGSGVGRQTGDPGGQADIERQTGDASTQPADPERQTGDPNPSDNRTQILLIEDSPELAAFITGILAGQYDVHHALNGAQGLEQTLAVMPDIIISDVMMPVMNGFEFCGRVKTDIRTNHIPVIMLTAKTAQEDLIEGLTLGANDYLAKPFHPTELLLRIRNLLDAQQKLRERLYRELSRPLAPALPGPDLASAVEPAPDPTNGSPADPAHAGPLTPAAAPPVLDIFLIGLYTQVEAHLDDADFGVDQLTGLLNLSRSSLHRKLKSLTGLSTTEVVRNFRLSKAVEFLRQGFNSSDAAYKSGFGSPAYFTKCFREVYGLTPTDFVRQTRQPHA